MKKCNNLSWQKGNKHVQPFLQNGWSLNQAGHWCFFQYKSWTKNERMQDLWKKARNSYNIYRKSINSLDVLTHIHNQKFASNCSYPWSVFVAVCIAHIGHQQDKSSKVYLTGTQIRSRREWFYQKWKSPLRQYLPSLILCRKPKIFIVFWQNRAKSLWNECPVRNQSSIGKL